MAFTSTIYEVFVLDLGAGVHNFTADTDKVALLTSAYTPDFTGHTTFADVSAAEVTGNGYTAGGQTLNGKTWTFNAGPGDTVLGASAVSWTDLAVTTRYAVLYKSTGTAGTSRLISLFDFGEDRVYATEPFQLSFPSGVVALHANPA